MKKYKKKFKISKNIIIGITGILFSIGLPFIVLPIFVPAQQLWTPKFTISAVALFLTFYSVEAAILVAVMIYKMQK